MVLTNRLHKIRIAEELEEDMEVIRPIYEKVKKQMEEKQVVH